MNTGKQYESKFREWAKKNYDVVIKIPDYAMTGNMTPAPCDYLCIENGYTAYYEVKSSKSKTSFPLANIRENQLNMMYKIWKHGKVRGVFFFIFMNRKKHKLHIMNVVEFMNDSKRKSLPIKYLSKYEVN